jgi:hypothetical protein
MNEGYSQGTPNPLQPGLQLIGIVFIVIYALVGGLMIGTLAFFVARYLWLIFLFPVIIGFLGGGLYSELVKKYRIRSTWLVILIGVLMSLLIYFTRHYIDYLETMRLLNAEGVSFWRFMQINASLGFSFSRFGGSGTPVSGLFVWLYWLVEVAISGGIIAFLGSDVSKQPFCKQCKDWYQGGTLIGSVDPEEMATFVTALQQGDYKQASGLIDPEYDGPVRLDVFLRRCNNEAHDLLLNVDYVETEENKIRKREIWNGSISPQYAQTFKLS